MNRFFFIAILFGLLACKHLTYSNQSEDIIVEDADFDFGIIPDSIERLYHRFSIANNTSDTCLITRIEKSCGCTNVKLSNHIIAPFSSVFLDVEIDLGSNYSFFERDITLYTNCQNEPLTIFVRASRMMPTQVIHQEFPLKISDKLRANIPYIILGNISFGESKLGYLNILNISDEIVTFSAEIIDAFSFVDVYYEEEIAPNEVGRIIVAIDLSEVTDIWGLQKYELLIKTGDDMIKIPIEAIFMENFTCDEHKPRILVPANSYTIDTSIKTEVRFLCRNIGKDTLYIRNVKGNGRTSSISVSSYQIPPNSQGFIVVKVGKDQEEDVELGITTNDPIEPYKIVRVFCNSSQQ